MQLLTINFQSDDPSGNGPQLKGCEGKNPYCAALIAIGIITIIKVVANKIKCNASEDESCKLVEPSKPHSETLPSEKMDYQSSQTSLPPFLQLEMDIPQSRQPLPPQEQISPQIPPKQVPRINPFNLINKQRLMYY